MLCLERRRFLLAVAAVFLFFIACSLKFDEGNTIISSKKLKKSTTTTPSSNRTNHRISTSSSSVSKPRPCNDTTITSANIHLATREETIIKHPNVFAFLPPEYEKGYKSPCWWSSTSATDHRPLLRCLPYAYIIGEAKCGTTDLYAKLCQHPDVIPNDGAGGKGGLGELFFWHGLPSSSGCYPHRLQRGRPIHGDSTIQNYTTRFSQLMKKLQETDDDSSSLTKERVFTMDSSVQSAGGDIWTPKLLYEAQPNARIIMRTRDPTKRAASHWVFFGDRGDPNVVLPAIVRKFQQCLRSSSEYHCFEQNGGHPIMKGLYILNINRWLRVFPRSQFLVVPLEAGTIAAVRDAGHFLNLTTFTPSNLGQIENKQEEPETPLFSNETIALLNDFFRPYNQRLLDFIRSYRNPKLASMEVISGIESYGV